MQVPHHHFHAILIDLLLPIPASNSSSSSLELSDVYPLIHPLLAYWMRQASSSHLSKKKKAEGKGKKRRRQRSRGVGLDQSVLHVSPERCGSCPGARCCLLLIIILFLYLSLQKHARLLLLHGNHLLVSLSCSAASLIHNRSHTHKHSTPISAMPGRMQQQTTKQPASFCLL